MDAKTEKTDPLLDALDQTLKESREIRQSCRGLSRAAEWPVVQGAEHDPLEEELSVASLQAVEVA
jgi:hypothetical protein